MYFKYMLINIIFMNDNNEMYVGYFMCFSWVNNFIDKEKVKC